MPWAFGLLEESWFSSIGWTDIDRSRVILPTFSPFGDFDKDLAQIETFVSQPIATLFPRRDDSGQLKFLQANGQKAIAQAGDSISDLSKAALSVEERTDDRARPAFADQFTGFVEPGAERPVPHERFPIVAGLGVIGLQRRDCRSLGIGRRSVGRDSLGRRVRRRRSLRRLYRRRRSLVRPRLLRRVTGPAFREAPTSSVRHSVVVR